FEVISFVVRPTQLGNESSAIRIFSDRRFARRDRQTGIYLVKGDTNTSSLRVLIARCIGVTVSDRSILGKRTGAQEELQRAKEHVTACLHSPHPPDIGPHRLVD